MGQHDKYGKLLMKIVAGKAYNDSGESIQVRLGNEGFANIDGTVGVDIAVEIESRVSKQVRGAILDLILHKYPKKLLVLLPVHMNNPENTVEQCKFVMEQFLDKHDFQVVLLQGHGDNYMVEEDTQIIKLALGSLGFV